MYNKDQIDKLNYVFKNTTNLEWNNIWFGQGSDSKEWVLILELINPETNEIFNLTLKPSFIDLFNHEVSEARKKGWQVSH